MTLPVGQISLAEDSLRTTLADSAEFRTWVGAVDQATALDDIYLESLPEPATKPEHTLAEMQGFRPFGLIWTPDDGLGFTHGATSSTFDFDEHGVLILQLQEDVDPSIKDDAREIALRFKNHLGVILDDFRTLAGEGPYLAMTDVQIEFGPYRGDKKTEPTMGDYMGVDLRIEWGSLR